MPSDKRNSITAKATGLIFSLFDVASARGVPFGVPQYIQGILHGLTSVLLLRLKRIVVYCIQIFAQL